MSSKLKVDILENNSSSVSLPVVDLIDQTRYNSMGPSSFRNKIVDGRFDFAHLSTTQTTSGYGSDDMWVNFNNGYTTKTHSILSLAAGEIPDVPSAVHFSRTVVAAGSAAGDCCGKSQHIESVTTLAGKKVTVSFYAKSDVARNIVVELEQNFGSGGGSSIVKGIGATTFSLTNGWKRYWFTTTVPTISGKVVGSGGNDFLDCVFFFDAGTDFSTITNNLGHQSGTFDLACVQVEEGSYPTPFEELPISIAEQRLNRYYQYLFTNIDTPIGYNPPNAAVSQVFMRPVPMRTIPTQTFLPQSGGIAKAIGGTQKATSTSINAIHSTHFYFDICCNFSSYTYAAGDFMNINTYVIADARL